jgi:uncharacterized membrane protein YuzA (DUF378 family)
MRGLTILALVLMIVGALNWGLVGIFGFNLVSWLFGPMSIISRIVYILVGLSGIFGIAMLVRLSERHEDVCVPRHASTFATQL